MAIVRGDFKTSQKQGENCLRLVGINNLGGFRVEVREEHRDSLVFPAFFLH
jgi:hypothetical protein